MKNRTVICHFYNEEYLLPWWLNHHKNIFSHGLMINYGSTDSSIELIKKICPTWEIVDTRNEYFGAIEIDQEIQEYEKNIEGQRIVLNVTEFLVGNFSKIQNTNHDLLIGMASMVDAPDLDSVYPDIKKPLTSQRMWGQNPFKRLSSGARLLHSNKNIRYPVGRHYWNAVVTDDFMILRYKHSPWNDHFIKRKMQIAKKQPANDLARGWGIHHQLDKDGLGEEKLQYSKMSEDLSSIIKKYEYWSY